MSRCFPSEPSACVGVNVSKEGFRLLFRFEEPRFLFAPTVGDGCPPRGFSIFDIGDAPAALFSALHTDTSFLDSVVPWYEVCQRKCHSILLKNEQKFAKIRKSLRIEKAEKALKIKA